MGWHEDRIEELHRQRLEEHRRCGRRILEMRRGTTLTFPTQVRLPIHPQQSVTAPNPPIPQNITEWSGQYTAKYYVSDPDQQAVCLITTAPSSVPAGGSLVLTTPLQGMANVTQPPRATFLFPDALVELVWDVKWTDLAGNEWVTDGGVILVWPTATSAV